MKLFHLSDLHLGKRINSIPIVEHQKHFLSQIIEQVKSEQPNAVMIAGDIYDRSVPSEEAVALFDDFLYELSKLKTNVLIVSGNHDSAERLAFGGRIFNKNGIYISPEYNGKTTCVTLPDEHGGVNFYMLPFVTPSGVRAFFKDKTIENCTDAIRVAIDEMGVDTAKRNVLITHLYIEGAVRTEESETRIVGNLEDVDYKVLDPFDYVALGHLHMAQSIGRETVRYCGTPMKYTVKEAHHKKSITVVEIPEKGKEIKIGTIPLVPLLDWKPVIEGKYGDVTDRACDEFVSICLTDEEMIFDVRNKLRRYFPNLVSVTYKREEHRMSPVLENIESLRKSSPAELFAEFYKLQNDGAEMSEKQAEIVREIFEEIAGGNKNATDQA